MVVRRSAKIIGDPDRYIRNAKGHKYEARPWLEGRRYYLGLFSTKGAARIAIRKFWAGEIVAKPRFTKMIHPKEGTCFIAVVPIPDEDGVKRIVRVGGRYTTAQLAQGAAIAYLDKHLGAEARAAMMARG